MKLSKNIFILLLILILFSFIIKLIESGLIYLILAILIVIFIIYKFKKTKTEKLIENDVEFNQFYSIYQDWKNKDKYSNLDETVKYGLEIIKQMQTYNYDHINKLIKADKKKNGYNSKFTVYNHIDEIIRSIQYDIDKLNTTLTRHKEFIQQLNKISDYKIKLNTENVLKRNLVANIPEIKLSPIGKKFNIDAKLPSFVIVDLETTGLSSGKDRIISLSAIRYIDFEAYEKFYTLIHTNKEISKEVSLINGITNDNLVHAPTLDSIAEDFINFIGDTPLVGYNISFDLKFLYASGINLLNHKIYDVYELCKKVYPSDEVLSYKLVDIARYHGVEYPAHNSVNDAFATGIIFELTLNDYLDS